MSTSVHNPSFSLRGLKGKIDETHSSHIPSGFDPKKISISSKENITGSKQGAFPDKPHAKTQLSHLLNFGKKLEGYRQSIASNKKRSFAAAKPEVFSSFQQAFPSNSRKTKNTSQVENLSMHNPSLSISQMPSDLLWAQPASASIIRSSGTQRKMLISTRTLNLTRGLHPDIVLMKDREAYNSYKLGKNDLRKFVPNAKYLHCFEDIHVKEAEKSQKDKIDIDFKRVEDLSTKKYKTWEDSLKKKATKQVVDMIVMT